MLSAQANALWRVRLFGRLAAESEQFGNVTRFRSRTAAGVLAYLAVNLGRRVGRDELADAIWPDFDTEAARQNLRTVLASLRKQLHADGENADVLIADRTDISLANGSVTTDLEQFRWIVKDAERASSLRERVDLLSHALALVEGPLLSGEFWGWVVPKQLSFEEEHAMAVVAHVKGLIELGKPQEAALSGKNALVVSPNREDLHVAVIEALGACGMVSDALRQFELLETILEEQWGERPSAEAVRALETLPKSQAVFRSEPTDDFAPPPPEWSTESTEGTKNPLPSLMRGVIGRESDLNWLAMELDPRDDCRPRLWSVTGPGGIGKSIYALSLAHRLLSAYYGWIRVVNVELTTDPSVALATVCEAFGLTRGSVEENYARLAEHLTNRPALLVLDGYEQLVDKEPSLALRLAQEIPSLRILATSRRRLGLNVERSLPLSALEVPSRDVRLKDMASVSSVRLFVDRASAQRPDFTLNPSNAEAVAEICRRLDGMPLAIELAAAQISSMSPAQLLGRIGDRVLQLTNRWRDAPERHRNLSAVVEWSYDLLSDRAKRLFRAMGILRGGSTLETLETLFDEPDIYQNMDELVAASLVVSEEGGGGLRFRMLEPIRAFAEQALVESGDRDDVVRRHRRAYSALAEKLRHEFEGPNVKQAIRHIEAEHDNLRALAEHAMKEPECPPEALMMVSHLMQFFTLNGHYREWLDRTTQLLDRPLPSSSRNAVAGAYVTAGSMAVDLNDYETALRHYGKGLELAEETGDQLQIARALNNYSIATMGAGRFDLTETNLKRALEIIETMEDSESPYVPLLKIVIRINLGDNHRRAGNYTRAIPFFLAGMERAEEAGNLRLLTNLLLDFSNLFIATGDTEEALRMLDRADLHNSEVSSQELDVRSTNLRGMAHLRAGNLELAWENFVRGSQAALQGNAPSNVANGLYGLALAHDLRGRRERAQELAKLGREVDPTSGGLLSKWITELIEDLIPPTAQSHPVRKAMRDPQVIFAVEQAAKAGLPD